MTIVGSKKEKKKDYPEIEQAGGEDGHLEDGLGIAIVQASTTLGECCSWESA